MTSNLQKNKLLGQVLSYLNIYYSYIGMHACIHTQEKCLLSCSDHELWQFLGRCWYICHSMCQFHRNIDTEEAISSDKYTLCKLSGSLLPNPYIGIWEELSLCKDSYHSTVRCWIWHSYHQNHPRFVGAAEWWGN